MTSRRWILAFIAGVIIVLGALSWVTAHTLRLERSERAASNEARHQELVRLVLWRMDSALTPIIAREAARPYFEYQPFYPVDTRFTQTNAGGQSPKTAFTDQIFGALAASKAPDDLLKKADVDGLGQVGTDPVITGATMVPSPLLSPTEPHVRLYFEQDATGLRTSPQIPTGTARALAQAAYVTEYSVAVASERLAALDTLLSPDGSGALPTPTALEEQAETLPPAAGPPAVQQVWTRDEAAASQIATGEAAKQNVTEYRARQQATQFANRVEEPRGGGRTDLPPVVASQVVPGASAEKDIDPKSGEASPERTEIHKKEAQSPRGSAGSSGQQTQVPELTLGASASPAPSAAPIDADARSVIEGAVAADLPSTAQGGKPGGPGDSTLSDGAIASTTLSDAAESGVRLYGGPDVSGISVRQGQFAARWVVRPGAPAELIFEREMEVGSRRFTQGIWLDWPSIKQLLLDTAQGLLPVVDLVPILDLSAIGPDDLVLGRTLAAIPVELIAPAPPMGAASTWTPARTALILMWLVVVGAVVAAGTSLYLAAELAQRRGQFVSAVTHELRTPLTTFCLYSQMLADGIVTEGEAQKSYFQTLKIESLRLARIVESVLDYARLSGRSMPRACTDLAVESLIGSLTRVLNNRCEQSGMLLEVTIAPQVGGQIRTDPTIVERILFNLVENACKYAVDAEDPTVHLDITADAAWLKLAVRDHGPGIDPADQPRIFRPFTRGKLHAHGGIPGLGLGLALAQGLAKELGGHLELAPTEDGACFVLSLPR